MLISFSGFADYKKKEKEKKKILKDTPLEFNPLFSSFVKLPVILKCLDISKKAPHEQ